MSYLFYLPYALNSRGEQPNCFFTTLAKYLESLNPLSDAAFSIDIPFDIRFLAYSSLSEVIYSIVVLS